MTNVTVDGTALNGLNYLGVTNILAWADSDFSTKYINVPILHDGLVGPPVLYFTNKLSSVAGGVGSQSNATVNITQSDFYGNLSFSATNYNVNENGGYATITVIRTAGSAQGVNVSYATHDGKNAFAATNYAATGGTLTFGPGEVAKSFNVPVLDDGKSNSTPFYFTVSLTNPNPSGIMVVPTNATVSIQDAEGSSYHQPGPVDTGFNPLYGGMNDDVYCVALQPNGQIIAGGNFTQVNGNNLNRIVRLNANNTVDTGFLNSLTGANGAVEAVVVQTDGRVLLGGAFSRVNGFSHNSIARLQTDGSSDTSFSANADSTVFALVETFAGTNRQVLAGGAFLSIGGSGQGIARLNNDGSTDSSFNAGGPGVNGAVYAIAVYPTNGIQAGKIMIGGDFTNYNNIPRNHLARLNPDGSLDLSFDPGTNISDTVRALAIQLDGRVLVGGSFPQAINRFNMDGLVDTAFNAGAGANDTVKGIAVQADNRIVVVGLFTQASGVSRNRITRLMPDGTVDPSINFGTGANGYINAVVIQPNGEIIIGGGFTQVEGQPCEHIARLYGGSMTGSGNFTFTAGAFQVDENGTNVVIAVQRTGGTSGPQPDGSGNVTVNFSTSNGTAVAGVNYSNVAATLAFAEGETLQTVTIPVMDDLQITPDLTVNLTLANPSPPAALGGQPVATLTIINDDSGVSFTNAPYSCPENIGSGVAPITVTRIGSTRGTNSVDFITTTNGTAVAGVNYLPATNTLTFNPGDTTLTVTVPVLHDPLADGDKTVIVQLTNAVNALLMSPSVATLTIQDVDSAPGQFMFSAPAYTVGEGDGNAYITIIRTNGNNSANPVSVNYTLVPGTASPGINYSNIPGTLTFLPGSPGDTVKTITVPIIQNSTPQGNLDFHVVLSNPTGGASITGPTSADVTIMDDNVGVGFPNLGGGFPNPPFYGVLVNELDGSVTLSVLRVGTTNGTVTVNYTTTNNVVTTNGTAMAGTNYVAITNGSLTFNPGETIKNFNVQILHDGKVTGPLSFGVNLYNPGAPAQLMQPSQATVTILDGDPGISFTNNTFTATKGDSNVLFTVVRSSPNSGTVSVGYTTSDGTAVANEDYVSTAGSLVFTNGVTVQTFSVPLLLNNLLGGDKTFTVSLQNPLGGAQLVPPSTATVFITNNTVGLSFSSSAYSVKENGVAAAVTVLRSNFTNSTVAVNFTTANGTALPNANYYPTNGFLIFTNGEIAKTFLVRVIDDGVIDGDHTVLLSLFSPTNGILINPNAATLNVQEADGSLILPAGAALISESGPTNGVIDPGETVGLLFAFRNSSGFNTTNLVATLLATNGITSPSSAASYGVLTVGGPSVSRPFTFTASGTNGQTIAATFQLQDGSVNLGRAVFNFTLGTTTTTYSNSAFITINDATAAGPSAATPYPSIINVAGVIGVVDKVTVTLTNLYIRIALGH